MLIIKLGGSILNLGRPVIDQIANSLIELSYNDNMLIITGGGRCVNILRKIDRRKNIGEISSHWLSIMCMHLNAYRFYSYFPGEFKVTSDLDYKSDKKIPVLLPFDIITQSSLPTSWEVTSDTISAYIAKLTKGNLILVKDVDGMVDSYPDGKLIRRIGAKKLCTFQSLPVDTYLPGFLLKNNMSAWLINGLHPERLKMIKKNKKPIGTLITPDNGEAE